MDDVCVIVYLCERVFCNNNTEDAKLRTEGAQLEFNLLSGDENSGNSGCTHYLTQPPNVDVLYIALDLDYQL